MAFASHEWLRNRRRTRAWAAIAAAWAVGFAGLLLIPGRLPAHGPAAVVLAVLAFYVGIAAIGIVLAVRVARSGVWIEPDGIVIRGPLRTVAVELTQAGRFAPGLQGRGGNGVPCPMLGRRGRAAAGVWALGQRNVWFRYERLCDEIQPLCDELNALVAAQRPAR